MAKMKSMRCLKGSGILYGILIGMVFIAFPSFRILGAETQPTVFKIQFEWGATSPEGYTFKGNAVAHYAPSSRWTGRVGVNWKAASGKGYDETSPAALYKGLGSLAAMRPDDELQFYKVKYTATVTTDNGCSVNDQQTESSDTYTAWIKRTPDGAVLQFGPLEAADSDARCDHYESSIFDKDLAPGQDAVKEKFFTFQLTNSDLANFKSIKKVNECKLEAVNPVPGKMWGKATLIAE